MAFPAGERSGGFAQINVTPLVDVMLVLLIIFMVAVPMLARTLALDLGSTGESAVTAEPARLVLAPDRQPELDGMPVPAGLLDVALAGLAAREPRPALAIAADPGLEYERLAEVLASARNAGLTQIGFELPAP